MANSDTWNSKQRKLKAQYQLYDDFLQSEPLTFDQRSKLIYEMARVLHVIKYIDALTLQESRKICDDYTIILVGFALRK